ncbi:MAG TPA: hypothetical protein DDW23_06730 [Planctomycetes bacterium]|nr:hypothetical protein [Planctomycetota bacterium]
MAGMVILTDSLPAPALQVLAELANTRPGLRVLLITGSRGLAGAETLLSLPGVQVLPEPWTPAGLASIAAMPGGAKALPVPNLEPPPEHLEPTTVGNDSPDSLDQIWGHLRDEDKRKADTIQSQNLEIARLKSAREQQAEQRGADRLLKGIFLHRDRIASLLEEAPEGRGRARASATLRSLDEFLMSQGIQIDEDPDPEDFSLSQVVAQRPRIESDPPSNQVVRRPAFFRMEGDRRIVLRPAQIETLN